MVGTAVVALLVTEVPLVPSRVVDVENYHVWGRVVHVTCVSADFSELRNYASILKKRPQASVRRNVADHFKYYCIIDVLY
uniref:Uncharacterized protein n=1 Tax=Romanomermis culicivorax TaxID=13658 RepID=A0A915KY94_ROMCU